MKKLSGSMRLGEARFRTRPQFYRIKRILEMIREGTQSGDYPNAGHFCRELEVSRPTVMRDLEWLRDEENAPIEYVPSTHGYRLSEPTWSLPPVELSQREVFAFSIAARLLSHFRGTPLELDVSSALDKIRDSLEGKITLDLEAITERFSVIDEDYVRQDPATWTALARFVERQERVEAEYEKFSGEVGGYELEPYHLFAYHGNWYVAARNVRKDAVETFAVSRIRTLAGTAQRFVVPKSFDPRAHIEKGFGIVRGDKVMRVRLLFSKAVTAYIRERVWHPSQRMIERRDGGLELSFETAGWKELVRWILSWQPDCRVLSPKSLRDRVREKMRQALRG